VIATNDNVDRRFEAILKADIVFHRSWMKKYYEKHLF
jgi:hypothetical protein